MTITATLSLNRRNLHCKHILLAASGDNSYAGFLQQFIAADGASQQMTLIESIPFARDLARLTGYFQTTKFDEVFRSSKIVAEKPAPNQNGTREPLAVVNGNAWANPASSKTYTLAMRAATSPEAKPAAIAKAGVPVPKPHKEILVSRPN